MINIENACGILNSLGEQKIISFFRDELSDEETEEIESWLEESSELREAFDGFRSLMDRFPDEFLNNYFQSSYEVFIQKTALKLANNIKG